MRKTLHIVIASLILLCAWGVSSVFAQSGTGRPFITKWQGEAGKELKIPIVGTYKMVIKDESGNEKLNATVTVADAEHPYIFTPTEDGTYTVEAGPEGVKYMQMRVTWSGRPFTSNNKLLEVVQFGTVKWESMKEMFSKCWNMTFASGIDTPDLSNVTNMNGMFYDCAAFNQPLEKWNVSKVTNMTSMFNGCTAFNQPLEKWAVSYVIGMGSMFYGCRSFNQPLERWDVSDVTNMSYMFYGCTAFNQPLEKWHVRRVTEMSHMFEGCRSFNQPLNNWEVDAVKTMGDMFKGCSSFNQPLGSWKIKKAVGGLNETAMSPSNYSQTLVGWAAQTDITQNLYFGENVKNLIYNNDGKAAREKLIAKGWTFDGDIHQPSGITITPRSLSLVSNEKDTLLLEKWGIEETEAVTLSSDPQGVISYEFTADKKGIQIKGLKEGRCLLTATIAAKEGVHKVHTSTCEVNVAANNNGNKPGDNNENKTSFSVTLTQPANGKIEIEGHATETSITVAKDTELTVKATPDEGYKLKELKANDEDITTTKKFTVKAATTITAIFESEHGGAVEDALLSSLSVAPNPFTSQLRILNPEGVTARYELVNTSGMVVRSGALSGSEAIVDTEALPAGVYFVRLEAQNGAQKTIKVSK